MALRLSEGLGVTERRLTVRIHFLLLAERGDGYLSLLLWAQQL